MSVKPEIVRLTVAGGALMEVPVWDESRRAKNWAAVVGVDPAMPGGLSRRWLPKGRGICFFVIEQVAVLDVIEFAGDRTAWSGNTVQNRWYGIVIGITQTELALRRCKDAKEALMLVQKTRSGEGPDWQDPFAKVEKPAAAASTPGPEPVTSSDPVSLDPAPSPRLLLGTGSS